MLESGPNRFHVHLRRKHVGPRTPGANSAARGGAGGRGRGAGARDPARARRGRGTRRGGRAARRRGRRGERWPRPGPSPAGQDRSPNRQTRTTAPCAGSSIHEPSVTRPAASSGKASGTRPARSAGSHAQSGRLTAAVDRNERPLALRIPRERDCLAGARDDGDGPAPERHMIAAGMDDRPDERSRPERLLVRRDRVAAPAVRIGAALHSELVAVIDRRSPRQDELEEGRQAQSPEVPVQARPGTGRIVAPDQVVLDARGQRGRGSRTGDPVARRTSLRQAPSGSARNRSGRRSRPGRAVPRSRSPGWRGPAGSSSARRSDHPEANPATRSRSPRRDRRQPGPHERAAGTPARTSRPRCLPGRRAASRRSRTGANARPRQAGTRGWAGARPGAWAATGCSTRRGSPSGHGGRAGHPAGRHRPSAGRP